MFGFGILLQEDFVLCPHYIQDHTTEHIDMTTRLVVWYTNIVARNGQIHITDRSPSGWQPLKVGGVGQGGVNTSSLPGFATINDRLTEACGNCLLISIRMCASKPPVLCHTGDKICPLLTKSQLLPMCSLCPRKVPYTSVFCETVVKPPMFFYIYAHILAQINFRTATAKKSVVVWFKIVTKASNTKSSTGWCKSASMSANMHLMWKKGTLQFLLTYQISWRAEEIKREFMCHLRIIFYAHSLLIFEILSEWSFSKNKFCTRKHKSHTKYSSISP